VQQAADLRALRPGGRGFYFLKMVKPTGTSDAIVSTNRFAILGSATCNSQNPGTLLDANGAFSDVSLVNNNNKGAISKNKIVNVNNVIPLIPGLNLDGGRKGKQIRDRSNSVKRKNSGDHGIAAKTPHVEMSECPHLKTINENKVILARVLDSMTDYQGEDSVIAANVRSLSLCMNSINDILATVMAERLVPGDSPEVVDCEVEPDLSGNHQSAFQFPPSNSSRQLLKQQPLGNTETWATAVGKNKKKTQSVQNTPSKPDIQPAEKVVQSSEVIQESKFTKALKEAERSILVNLGLPLS
jgi:hypothetical protein